MIDVYTNETRNIFTVNELVTLVYRIKNNLNENVKINQILNVIPSEFLVVSSNYEYKKESNVIEIDTELQPGGVLYLYISAKTEQPAKCKAHTATLTFFIKSKGIHKIEYTEWMYIILPPEKISFIDIEKEMEFVHNFKKHSIVSELLKSQNFSFLTRLIKDKKLLSFKFAFIIHDGAFCMIPYFKDISDLADFFYSSNSPRTSLFTFITGARFIGKSTFASLLFLRLSQVSDKKRYVIAVSLKGRYEDVSEIINEAVIENFNAKYSTLEEAISEASKRNAVVELWIDVDFYKAHNPIKKLANFLTQLAHYYGYYLRKSKHTNLRIFIILHEENMTALFREFSVRTYNEIRLLSYTEKEALIILTDKIKGIRGWQKKKLIRSIVHSEGQHRIPLKPPFLVTLISELKKLHIIHLWSGKYVKEKIIIKTIYNTLKDVYRGYDTAIRPYGIPIHEMLKIEKASKLTPELIVEHPNALEIETNHVVPRNNTEQKILSELHYKETNVVFITGWPITGKTTLALKVGYELWKQGSYIIYVRINDLKDITTFKGLAERLREIDRDVIVILEDAHFDTNRELLMNFFYECEFYKCIVTERVGGPIKEDVYSEKVKHEFISPADQNFKTLVNVGVIQEVYLNNDDFKEFVRNYLNFLKSQKAIKIKISEKESFETIVNKLSNATANNIFLLQRVLEPFIEQKQIITSEQIEKISFDDAVKDYINNIFNMLEAHNVFLQKKESLVKILLRIAWFSRNGLGAPERFLYDRLRRTIGRDAKSIDKVLKILLTHRELVCSDISGNSVCFYTIPNKKLAQYIFLETSKKVWSYKRGINDIAIFLTSKYISKTALYKIIAKLGEYQKPVLNDVITQILSKEKLAKNLEGKLKVFSCTEMRNLLELLFPKIREPFIERYRNLLLDIKLNFLSVYGFQIYMNKIFVVSPSVAEEIIKKHKSDLKKLFARPQGLQELLTFLTYMPLIAFLDGRGSNSNILDSLIRFMKAFIDAIPERIGDLFKSVEPYAIEQWLRSIDNLNIITRSHFTPFFLNLFKDYLVLVTPHKSSSVEGYLILIAHLYAYVPEIAKNAFLKNYNTLIITMPRNNLHIITRVLTIATKFDTTLAAKTLDNFDASHLLKLLFDTQDINVASQFIEVVHPLRPDLVKEIYRRYHEFSVNKRFDKCDAHAFLVIMKTANTIDKTLPYKLLDSYKHKFKAFFESASKSEMKQVIEELSEIDKVLAKRIRSIYKSVKKT